MVDNNRIRRENRNMQTECNHARTEIFFSQELHLVEESQPIHARPNRYGKTSGKIQSKKPKKLHFIRKRSMRVSPERKDVPISKLQKQNLIQYLTLRE
jgi:hypothetical protein